MADDIGIPIPVVRDRFMRWKLKIPGPLEILEGAEDVKPSDLMKIIISSWLANLKIFQALEIQPNEFNSGQFIDVRETLEHKGIEYVEVRPQEISRTLDKVISGSAINMPAALVEYIFNISKNEWPKPPDDYFFKITRRKKISDSTHSLTHSPNYLKENK